ncbi:DUF1289 domain-containing protein [Frigidibacter albus]|uniref:DUF1289 domain-containing protein n=1 Tax=Frigidibacter albus TaxID=1465486 RepID=A0A6L8VD10_9RHOB|nr:DUF1289 domain-containing protein [Frigidibacter albus]MZQ88208.1 DUF1289 domain-containing protein [Frigidibacter albus]NBE30118.1 DUF1289 domain-containing protein [Frigidibacter albus]GGH46801.1 DUF1289 domain-containing protein [Frigidibacter albus]
MMDDVWKRDEIESPCVKLCVMHPAEGLCMGCYRTLSEIGGWSGMSPEARRAVIAELPGRAPRVAGARRGGHEGRLRRERQ